MTFNDLRYEIAVHSPPGHPRPVRIWANHIDIMDVMIDLDQRMADGVTSIDHVNYVDTSTREVKQRPEGWTMTIDGVDVHRDSTLQRGSFRVDIA